MITRDISKIGDIKLHIKNIEYYATESFFLYSSIINNHLVYANSLAKNLPSKQSRADAIRSIKDSTLHNLKTLQEVQTILRDYISPEQLTFFRPNPNDDLSGYFKDLKYLKRDWSWSIAPEIQLDTLTKHLNSELEKLLSPDSNAVFLGAGLGRFSFNLAHLFDRVYAIDKSFSMAYHYNKLLKENIEFYEIFPKNVYSASHSVGKITSTIYPPHLEKDYVNKRVNKIDYIVSDVMNLPFNDNSISTVLSIYFTDVIALKLWLPEVTRVLKDDGYFIHLGPLDYFFTDITEMLSAEEIKETFEEYGFETKVDTIIETSHLHSDKHFSNKVYQNWLFIAKRKSSTSSSNTITNDTILKLGRNVNYLVNGTLETGGESKNFQLILPSGEIYEGAETALEIIRFVISKERQISEIIVELQFIYGEFNASEITYIFTVINKLIEKKVLITA